ncbi:MAG: HD domain-containing protein [Oceanidesulfovibrio sp.]
MSARSASTPTLSTVSESGLLAEHLDRFRSYTDRYLDDSVVEDHKPIALKIEHSLRVLENASLIIDAPDSLDAVGTMPAGGLGGFSYPALVRLAALYHDIGRFEQFRRYGTFHDKKSENHARLGVKVLRHGDLIADLPAEARRFIQGVVMLHNRRLLPARISRDVRYATLLIRDADKVDILRVMVDHFTAPDPADPVVTLHVKEHPTEYTASLLDGIMAGNSGDYMAMRWTNDFKLLMLGWIFHLSFRASLDMVREREQAEKLLSDLPDIPRMRALARKVRVALEPGSPAGGEAAE